MNIRIPITPELRVRLAHTDCLIVELPPEISTALEGREELMKSLTAADVPTDAEALRVERDKLSAQCDEQAQRIRELERHNAKLLACGDAACIRLKELSLERDTLEAANASLVKVLEYADNKLYILTHNRNDVSARLLVDADKAYMAVNQALSITAPLRQGE